MSSKGLKRYKTLTMGVIGTLIDYETGILDYIQPVAKGAGVSIAKSAILEAFGWAASKQHRATPDSSFTAMMAPIYSELAGVLGLPADKTIADGMKQSMQRWPVFEDSVEALQSLKRHYRLVALTNADNWAYWYMSKTLGNPFDDKVTAEDAGNCKPDIQVFAYCLGRQSVSGIARKDVLHVAQSQFHDIGTAQQLGYATAWIERRKGKDGFGATPEPDEVVTPTYHYSSLRELADAAEAAFRD